MDFADIRKLLLPDQKDRRAIYLARRVAPLPEDSFCPAEKICVAPADRLAKVIKLTVVLLTVLRLITDSIIQQMTKRNKILLAIALILVAIQLIRPARNNGEAMGPNDISKAYQVPAEVHTVLQQSCYDCHSNKTNYPWYANIQPIGWWLQSHINDGKRHLNFSEYGTYAEKKAKHKFEEIEDAAANGWMPMESYLWMHPETKLTPDQSKAIAQWAGALK